MIDEEIAMKKQYFEKELNKNISQDFLTSIGINIINDVVFELPLQPHEYSEGLIVIDKDENEISFSYLSVNEDLEPYEYCEGCIFETFRDHISKRERMNELKKEGYHVYSVEEYKHSSSSFALENEGNFPDRQWDVSPNSVIALYKDFTNPKKQARSILEQLNQYNSGNVFGLCSAVFDMKTADLKRENDCWGFIGQESAHETLLLENGSHNHAKDFFLKQIEPCLNKSGKFNQVKSCYSFKKGDGLEEIVAHKDRYFPDAEITKKDIDAIIDKKFPKKSRSNRP
jgi:hypothetical protein